jgi:hypothetical protein
MLRCKDKSIAKKAAAIAKKLADSNLVGYDQSQRNTLYQALKSCNWDVDKYIASGKKTETDCSGFIYAVFCCLIAALRADGNAPTTSTMRAKFKANGFTVYTESKYLTTDSNLITGDILVKEGSHTAMAITDGANASSTTATTTANTSTSGTLNKTEKWKGKVTATSLSVRSWAGTENKSLRTLKQGTKVSVCDSTKAKDGTEWYYICEGGKYGFCSAKHIAKA